MAEQKLFEFQAKTVKTAAKVYQKIEKGSAELWQISKQEVKKAADKATDKYFDCVLSRWVMSRNNF